MQVTTFGTRGSVPVAGVECAEFGGNTTCIRVHSECLPPGVGLIVDAGTGYRVATGDLLKEGIKEITLLHTHYHWDHIQGIPFGAHTFVPGCFTSVWGPKEKKDPLQVYVKQMSDEEFPIHFSKVQHQFSFHRLIHIGTQVLVFHPVGGVKLEYVHVFRQRDAEGGQLRFPKNRFGKGGSFAISQCLVVWMYKTEHPEYTVSYRFEERLTGKVFVFLTDHEVTAGFAADLLTHLRGADFLIQDVQFEHEAYRKSKVGWGHGTPVYAAETAVAAGSRRLGLTHHDPNALDADVRKRLEEARAHFMVLGKPELAESAFACADRMTIDV